MQVPSAARTALDTWLKVARLPFDTAAKVLPNGSEGPRNTVLLAIDRADHAADLALVEEQLPRPARLMVEAVGLQIFRNIGVDQPDLAVA